MTNKVKIYRGNPVAKRLRTSQFRQRVVPAAKQYNRAKDNRNWKREAYA